MDAAIPLKGDKSGGVVAAASHAYGKAKKSATGHH